LHLDYPKTYKIESTLQRAVGLIKDLEVEHNARFSIYQASKDFGNTGNYKKIAHT